jgi:class 3 adenylate cyclase
MADDELFAREEATITLAERLLSDGRFVEAEEREAYATLLKDYQKLFRTTRRLMRLSDRNERDLSAMAEKQRLAAEEISRKNKELETLSSKLAKYLSPQVYESIFTGKQEVKLASQRKKLTVFFSDIADFTETTDKMESEDLTQLLNQYLTEMSQVALEYGATVDKYVGDAIMIFFGDPETRGVKKDALACVRMAIAMQKRMRALEDVWRSSGVEQPMRCRIGISTGYCTVGNFGSEDRMDYTIIGGGVNLASRLEHAAPPGGILISYETYAHVKDEVYCEPRGHLEVKGIAYPVAIYEVVDLYENLGEDRHLIHEDHPSIKIALDLDALSVEQRREAASILQSVLDRLVVVGTEPAPRPPVAAPRRRPPSPRPRASRAGSAAQV